VGFYQSLTAPFAPVRPRAECWPFTLKSFSGFVGAYVGVLAHDFKRPSTSSSPPVWPISLPVVRSITPKVGFH